MGVPPIEMQIYNVDKSLDRFLKKNRIGENQRECRKAFVGLKRLVIGWMRGLSHESNVHPSVKVMPFGSYRLGVQLTSSDIDVLVVAPKHVSREEFFDSFLQILNTNQHVSKLIPIQRALVPLIKVTYKNVEMDVLFAQLALPVIPKELDITKEYLLHGVDEQTLNSLNGCRVAGYILKLMKGRASIFKLALRAIKFWAMRRGIYSTALGYFGGVTWAIMLAQIFKLHPDASATSLIYAFFTQFSEWNWDTPVELVVSTQENKPLTIEDFIIAGRMRSKTNFDHNHAMSVLTPIYRQMNTSFNVSKFTKIIIKGALKNGLRICKKTVQYVWSWEIFFREVEFFKKYHHYLCLIMMANTEEDEVKYTGFMQARIRYLIKSLGENPRLLMAHINPKKFVPLPSASFTGDLKLPVCAVWFIGLRYEKNSNKELDFFEEFGKFTELLARESQTSNMDTVNIGVHLQRIPRDEVQEFISLSDSNLTSSTPSSSDPPLQKGAEIVPNSAPVAEELSESTSAQQSSTTMAVNSTAPKPGQTWAQMAQSSSKK